MHHYALTGTARPPHPSYQAPQPNRTHSTTGHMARPDKPWPAARTCCLCCLCSGRAPRTLLAKWHRKDAPPQTCGRALESRAYWCQLDPCRPGLCNRCPYNGKSQYQPIFLFSMSLIERGTRARRGQARGLDSLDSTQAPPPPSGVAARGNGMGWLRRYLLVV